MQPQTGLPPDLFNMFQSARHLLYLPPLPGFMLAPTPKPPSLGAPPGVTGPKTSDRVVGGAAYTGTGAHVKGRPWINAVLKQLGAPATTENVRFLEAWGRAEGGGGYGSTGEGQYNWLNTMRGTTSGWNQANFASGVHNTVGALTNGYYDHIVAAMKSGKATAEQMGQMVAASPWGTHAGVLRVLRSGPLPVVSGGGVQRQGGGTAAATVTPAAMQKWVAFAQGANRAGAPVNPMVPQFVAQIAQLYGRKLVIGTGTNHHEYVLGEGKTISDHWYGDAADIPMSGAALTRLGQTALIAAGANAKWARQQRGGVYNVNGYNILFNTTVGGNHYNHLHVGLGRRAGSNRSRGVY
jgi:hypothetical protein